ncbi:MAG TPA: valine--tRNA ligase [Candidatus Dependentiae bacterium]|nr:valine--tRNA ligase [Candidatus Dependentiae bacterium]HRQ62955.1 valine--tRNA ligase [Candidatus Dependentiae bacterium]
MEKRFDHQTHQQLCQKKWEHEKTYDMANNPGQLYSIDTPPPTVSGSLHIGHIFSYTQTDFIARYKRMNGFSVFYPFGFDDNGLPTERYVEKKRKVKAHQVGRSAFIDICLEETQQAERAFQELWQRMGLSADWSNWYSTISTSVRKLSQESFIDLYKKGFIYRKDEPALYCTTCRTSVAQAELDSIEIPSFFNDIVFKDYNGNDLIIGTTRPELLPSCVALLYHPQDERYQYLRGTTARVPLFDFEVPILADEKVNPDKGTGLVMCCTFGDTTDIEWYKKFSLPYKQSIGFDGKMLASTQLIADLKVEDARKKIIEELIKTNLLLRQRPITHAVNVHERCKKEIEYLSLKQWFINILDHKQAFLDMADRIHWYPTFMKSRYINWVENIGWDWCISRQRFFGIPFPVWHCQDCNEIILAKTEQLPVDPQEVTPPTCTCGSKNIVPDTDVMDTWNTSSISPYICYQLFTDNEQSPFDPSVNISNFIPMSMRPQAHDIIRTWAFYTIVKSWMHHGIIPWQNIVISGHVLSDQKEKLSKSKDNAALAPENLLEKYPADVIRYWTASGSLGHDVAFSENQLKIGLRLVTKLWNAFIFTKEHIMALDNPSQLPEELGAINEWLLHSATETFTQYTKYFEQNEFGLALDVVEKFFWNNFCDNYLELIKHQLFNPQDYKQTDIHATQWTLYHVGLRILQLYAPYLPFVTESIYEQLYKTHEKVASLHQTKFAQVQQPYVFTSSIAIAEHVLHIAALVRKLKTEQQLSLKTPLEKLLIYVPEHIAIVSIKLYEHILRGVTQTQVIDYKVGSEKTSELKEVAGLWHAQIQS